MVVALDVHSAKPHHVQTSCIMLQVLVPKIPSSHPIRLIHQPITYALLVLFLFPDRTTKAGMRRSVYHTATQINFFFLLPIYNVELRQKKKKCLKMTYTKLNYVLL